MADRMLVVDDDESVLELCATTFRLDGWQVETADCGDHAVKLLDGAAFDLVLTDLLMPGKLDGQGVVRAVKGRFPDTEVVVMTAAPTLDTAINTLKDGAADYVIKPFETGHLKLVVQRVIESGRLRRALGTERAMRQELSTAYAELQKVESLKESFLSRISHELRTPLSEVVASVALLEIGGNDAAKVQKYIAICKSGAEKLDRTLSDLLAFVELQGDWVVGRREAVDLQALCREAAAKLEPLWRPRRVSVEVRFEAGMPPVSGDRALLARAIEQLLQNAVLFNREGGKVTLEGSVREGSVYLSVTDTGEGIPEAEFERIFDSFYQIANYLTRKVGGMGLGLAITRRIAEAHGGHIGVSSKVGEGSTFKVRLPVEAPRP